jgi:hypothetical protein
VEGEEGVCGNDICGEMRVRAGSSAGSAGERREREGAATSGGGGEGRG